MKSARRNTTVSGSFSSHRKAQLLLVIMVMFLGIGLYFIARPKAATPFPASRDKYKWPYSRYSPWNMPIGMNAQYADANFTRPTGQEETRYGKSVWSDPSISVDADIIGLNPNDPLKDILQTSSSSWGRYPNLGGNQVIGKGHIPANAYWQGGISGPNNACATFLAEDTNKYHAGQYVKVDPAGSSPSWDYTGAWNESLTGIGIFGCHGGSSTNGSGYAIRISELTGEEPIRHALGMEVGCLMDCSQGADGSGHRWPAVVADGYYNTGFPTCWAYSNPDLGLTMGTLLALPRDFNVSSIQDARVRKIAQALQHYGAYIVDDTCGHHYRFVGESDGGGHATASASWWPKDSAFQTELLNVVLQLKYIANNSPTSVGGGGTPLTCYAPPFSNGTDDIANNPNGNVAEPAGCPGSTGGPTPTPTPTTNPTPTTPPTPTPTALPSGTDNPGDIDGDGHATFTDLTILVVNYKKTGVSRQQGDLDGDGTVTIFDLSRLVKYWGT